MLSLTRSGEMNGTTPQIQVVEQFDPLAMQAFRRRPDVYWPAADALSPPPEAMDFVGHMLHRDVWTIAGMLAGHIFGFVEFTRRTSVMAELSVGFHPQFRGTIARAVIQFAIKKAFEEKGLVKLCAPIASDNRQAIMGARLIGFKEEGRLTRAIVRQVKSGPPLRDLVIMGLSKETRE